MPLRLLLVEDSADDSELVMRELRRAGFQLQFRRVETAEAFARALEERAWDLVISDFNVPGFGAMQALHQMQERGHDLPFIVVSGAIGEDVAVACMKAGAHDYVMKDRLTRLGEAVRRELRDAEIRRERADSNAALVRTEERFRQLIEMLPDIVVVHVREQIVYANRRAATAFQKGVANALLGDSIRVYLRAHVIGEGDSLQPLLDGALDESGMIEVSSRRPDGSDLVLEASSRRVLFNGADAVLVVARDVTERREVTARMMQLDRLAAVGSLAAGVAHEVNNPLAYVCANLEFACEELAQHLQATPALGELSRALEDAREGAERIRIIVNDLRTFSRREEGPVGVFDVRRSIESALKMVGFRGRHRARIATEFESVPLVRGTESRAAQVVLNLVVNALDAFEDAQRHGNGIITVRVRRAERGVLVEVSDNGPGISPAVQANIFEPFFTTKAPGAGTGLGLSISRTLVRESGGELDFETEPGVGTTFRIWLATADEEARVTPSDR